MKELTELELCILFAELEELALVKLDGGLHVLRTDSKPVKYNPISDLALLAKAMFKYGVSIYFNDDKCSGQAGFCYEGLGFAMPLNKSVFFDSKKAIPRAVLICILKSEGKL